MTSIGIILETLTLASLIALYCLLLLLLPGMFVVKLLSRFKLAPFENTYESDSLFRFVITLGTGLIVLSASFAGVKWLEYLFQVNLAITGHLAILFALVVAPWSIADLRLWAWQTLRTPLVCLYLSYLLFVFLAAFPDGDWRGVSTESVMALTSMPIDGQIPYNFSRYVLENIPFNSFEVVPGWSAFDRGPLAALAFSAIVSSLGLRESSAWLGTSPQVYFPFQAVLTLFNLLSILAVWAISEHYYGRFTARLSMLVLLSSQFFVTSAILTWPKLLAAFFLLCGMLLIVEKKKYLWTGLFIGAAVLSHDYALFIGGIIGLYCLWRGHFRGALHLAFAVLLLVSPWLITRFFFADRPSQLINLQVFCSDTTDAQVSLVDQFNSYIQKHSWSAIGSIKASNVVYPFNPLPAIGLLEVNNYSLLPIFQNAHGLTFFRVLFNTGLLFAPFVMFLLLTSILASIAKRNRSDELPFLTLLLISLLGLLPYSLILGCRDFTVSHVWAYPLVCLLAIAIGQLTASAIAGRRYFLVIYAGVAIATNIFQTFIYFWFVSASRPYLHASNLYNLSVFVLGLSLLWCLLSTRWGRM